MAPTAADLANALRTARRMVAANLAEAADPDNDPETRYGAEQAAFGQSCLLELFAGLIGEKAGVDLAGLGVPA